MTPISRRAALAGAALAAAASTAANAQSAATNAPKMKKGYADGPYGQIHYRIVQPLVRSSKTPLLCLHASPLNGVVYENWIKEIGKDRLAVAPDTPGYGDSEAPPAPVMIGDFADAMIAFMDNMKLPVVDVMGYHTGSMTSINLAGRYPKRIRKVVLISAPNYTPEERKIAQARVGAPNLTFEQTLASALDGYRKNGKGELFKEMPDDVYFDMRLEGMRRFRTSNWGHRAAYQNDIAQEMALVNQPILLLNPEDDVYKTTPRVVPAMKNGKLVDLPGWNHGAMDIHTAEMARIVRQFLDA